MQFLYIFTIIAFAISFFADKSKTIQAFKIAYKKLKKIAPQFILMLIFISIVLYMIPEQTISYYLGGQNLFVTTIFAALLGSITILPGFIAFPMCGILLQQGVSFTTIAAFSTTLMMVGVVTFPVEKQYFGLKLSVYRNIASFIIAIAVALTIGFLYGEILI